MMMQQKVSKGQSVRAKNLLFTVHCSLFTVILLFTVHCSLSYAESLSDVKLDALHAPIKIKERWGRDPFIRYGDTIVKPRDKTFREDAPADLKISGIISDGKKAVAIINGGFYRKNEKVNGFLIVDIGKDRVSLEKNRKRFYLGVEKFAIDARESTTRRDKDMDDKEKGKKDNKEDKEAKQ